MDPLILCSACVAAQQIIAAAALTFNNILTQHEHRVEKKRRQKTATSYKHNVSMNCGPQKTILESVHVLDGLLHDEYHSTYRRLLNCSPSSSFFSQIT
jgi:hypothetical protein